MTYRVLLVAVAGLAAAAGCKHHRCCRPCDAVRPAPFRPPAPSAPGGTYLLPPADLPTTPAPSVVPPVGPLPPPPETRNFPPPVLDPLPSALPPSSSARPPAEVLLPDPLPPGNGLSRSRTLPADSRLGPLGSPVRPAPASASPPSDPVVVGVPGVVRVKAGLAAGPRPKPDELDRLRQAGYRTVIRLHAPGADVSADRAVATARGLEFVPLPVGADTLRDTLGTFNARVADPAGRPAYVWADEPDRAAILWYLHFRTADSLTDDVARVRAKPLGLTGEALRAWEPVVCRCLDER